jgi:hypothetical protein
MKSIVEVLKQKESELQQVQLELDALRLVMRLMSEDGEASGSSLAPTGTSSESRVKEISASPAAKRQFP